MRGLIGTQATHTHSTSQELVEGNKPSAMATDSAKEDMADLSLSKRTPPPPPGEDESTISTASEEAGMEAGGASEMKGEFYQSWTLFITMYISSSAK